MNRVIYEDFSDFLPSEFPYDHEHSALGEYHHVLPEGYMGNFYDPISLHQWRGLGGSWLITEAFGNYYLEQNRGDFATGHFSDVSAMLVHKCDLYAGYKLSFYLTLLKTGKPCGLAFNYIHNRLYDAIVFDGTNMRVYHKNQDEEKEYIKIPCTLLTLDEYKIDLILDDSLKIYLNNQYIGMCNIKASPGKIAFMGKNPARFRCLEVYMDDNQYSIHEHAFKDKEQALEEKRKKYSPLELVKKIDLKGCGAGRQFRLGYIDEKPVMLFAQHQKRMYRDSFARLSCLTAIDMDGNVLWQIGTPNNKENGPISCDLPFQIADINNDGKMEVIFAMDFQVYIVSLLDGKILSKMKTPYVNGDELVGDYPYDYLNPDGLRVADFEGLGFKGDFILKDRYKNVWAYRASDFKLLWRYNHKNTGHFPYIYDFDNDGRDEMFVGYDMVKDGKILWSLDIDSDHTDEIIYASDIENGIKRLYLASGNEGFNIVNIDGSFYKSTSVGHAQRISLAPYRGLNSLDCAVTSFWGADMLVYLFDGCGNLLAQREMQGNGNLVSPVMYDGDNVLMLTNTSPSLGGLLDSNLDTVVLFPDDGHPTLTAEVVDIDQDGVDEILAFDTDSLWIYKASKYHTGPVYSKYPDNAFSNYRGEYLLKYDSLSKKR